MTKQEQNSIIKNVWTRHLQDADSIPEDVADTYSIWLRGKIKQASDRLMVGQSSEKIQAQDEQ